MTVDTTKITVRKALYVWQYFTNSQGSLQYTKQPLPFWTQSSQYVHSVNKMHGILVFLFFTHKAQKDLGKKI